MVDLRRSLVPYRRHGVQRVELKPKGKIADKHKIAYSIVGVPRRLYSY